MQARIDDSDRDRDRDAINTLADWQRLMARHDADAQAEREYQSQPLMRVVRPARVVITVRRPDGAVEDIEHPSLQHMGEGLWPSFVQAMDRAGRGTPLAYRNVPADMEPAVCGKCGATLTQADDMSFAGHTLCRRCRARR